MKPIKELFSTYIHDLYQGHEVVAPASVQKGLFHRLDAVDVSPSSSIASGGFMSKAVLGSALVIVGFAWYLMPVSEDIEVVDPAVEELAVEELAVEELVVEELVVEELVVEELENLAEPTVKVNEIHQTVVVPTETVVANQDVDVDVHGEEPAKEIIQQMSTGKEVETTKKVEKQEKALEWVLPAKLEVDE